MIAVLLFALATAAPEKKPMNEAFVAALDRAIAGDPEVLKGFGFEEAMVTSPLWDDRIAVDGAGAVTVTSVRPPGDAAGVPIGTFTGALAKEELAALLAALRQLAAAPPAPTRSEAYETRVILSAVAGGHSFGLAVPASPPALEPLRPVLQLASRAMAQAMQKPRRSLSLALELPGGVPRQGAARAVLQLVNAGQEGFLVRNPAALPNQPQRDHARLVYAKPLVIQPGLAPLPVTPQSAFLSPPPGAGPQPEFVWVAPGAKVAVPLQAALEPGDAAELVLRAELVVQEGEGAVAGRPRLRGAVFSSELRVPVR